MDVSSFQNPKPFSGYKTVLRFTMIAEDIVMKIEAAKVYGDEEYDKRVSVLMLSLHQIIFSVYKLFSAYTNYFICFTIPHFQMLLLRFRRFSQISACGYFTVDRSLVTSFLGTTFTYWVILVQFTQTVEN